MYWDELFKLLFTYNAAGLLTEVVQADSATGTPMVRSVATYDTAGRVIESDNDAYAGGAWIPSSRARVAYDAQGNQTLFVVENWNSGTWTTSFGSQYVNTYDAAGRLTEQILQTASGGGSFVNDTRLTYTYPTGSNQWSTCLHETWRSGNWENQRFDLDAVWTAGTTPQLLSFRTQSWDFVNATFRDSQRQQITYGPNGNKTTVFEDYAAGSVGNWSPVLRLVTEYDNQLRYTADHADEWDATTAAWRTRNGHLWFYTYGSAGELLREVMQTYNTATHQYENETRTNYSHFINPTGIRAAAPAQLVVVSPNPTTDVVNLSHIAGATSITVRNAVGQLVLAAPADATQLNLRSLPTGLYTVTVTTATGSQHSKRVVKY